MDFEADASQEPPVKRCRIASQFKEPGFTEDSHESTNTDKALRSLTRDISPPLRSKSKDISHSQSSDRIPLPSSSKSKPVNRDSSPDRGEDQCSSELSDDIDIGTENHANIQERSQKLLEASFTTALQGKLESNDLLEPNNSYVRTIESPFRLTKIRDLPDEDNVDTITVYDILKDPMIKECWQFNYLFDIHFIMEALDPDVASMVNIKIVHGFWKADDGRRLRLQQQAQKYPNVELISAHIPEPFGTHHTKMMIMFRHDDAAQVVIHTANMIPQDWANLTQGVWQSPLLPLRNVMTVADSTLDSRALSEMESDSIIGSGGRFKTDLMRYLQGYERRTRRLVEELDKYDFNSIRAAFISSVPSHVHDTPTSNKHTEFGWPGLRQILSTISAPTSANPADQPGFVVAQVSSIATLSESWQNTFTSVLRSAAPSATPPRPPKAHIVFPTARDIRASLDGYASGTSIHAKLALATPAHQKQLARMRPLLRRWSSAGVSPAPAAALSEPELPQPPRTARRARAAPHIKTYVRFADARGRRVVWAALTSANLSTQAWGSVGASGGGGGSTASSAAGPNVRVASYEAGVVVWPALFGRQGERVAMVPVFGRDVPTAEDGRAAREAGCAAVVGLRAPYDLPLVPYGPDTLPWCGAASHSEPDWMGRVWGDGEPAAVAGKRMPGDRMMRDEDD